MMHSEDVATAAPHLRIVSRVHFALQAVHKESERLLFPIRLNFCDWNNAYDVTLSELSLIGKCLPVLFDEFIGRPVNRHLRTVVDWIQKWLFFLKGRLSRSLPDQFIWHCCPLQNVILKMICPCHGQLDKPLQLSTSTAMVASCSSLSRT